MNFQKHHLLSRKLDKGSSNKLLCVYGCAAGEKSYYGLIISSNNNNNDNDNNNIK
ncbi:hypothetical protein H8356DRAFT_1420815 [Neocallimastix lanati (nom. inval.)]|nr:hypothetical protein H8356DRAFT_1420815 [Neocallimastix sp. JGI-2020a]